MPREPPRTAPQDGLVFIATWSVYVKVVRWLLWIIVYMHTLTYHTVPVGFGYSHRGFMSVFP